MRPSPEQRDPLDIPEFRGFLSAHRFLLRMERGHNPPGQEVWPAGQSVERKAPDREEWFRPSHAAKENLEKL